MADTKLTDLTELAATPATGDFLYIVDVSNTTDDAAGSSRKIQAKYFARDDGNGATVTGGGTLALAGYTATVPATGTLVTTTATQTLTNKTLTSPTMTGPTTNNVTVSGANPYIGLTDTDTGADATVSAISAVGAMTINADVNNEVAGSYIEFSVDGAAEATLNGTGLSIGTGAAPIGMLNGHNGTGGFLVTTVSLTSGTAVTVIPNGTGDVTSALMATYVTKPSSGTPQGGIFNAIVAPGDSARGLFSDGGDAATLTVAADGSVTVQRASGTLTYTIALHLMWI